MLLPELLLELASPKHSAGCHIQLVPAKEESDSGRGPPRASYPEKQRCNIQFNGCANENQNQLGVVAKRSITKMTHLVDAIQ